MGEAGILTKTEFPDRLDSPSVPVLVGWDSELLYYNLHF